MTTPDHDLLHNHVTRDIKPAGLCPGCDQYHAKSVATEPEELPGSGDSFTLDIKVIDQETNTLDNIVIQVSGYSHPRAAVRALYKLGQEGYLANLYQALEGNYDDEDDETDDDD